MAYSRCLGGVISCNKPQKKIVCWGDSLTAPLSGRVIDCIYDDSYPNILQSMVDGDYEIINAGVGGEDTRTIMGRQGAYPFMLAHDIAFDRNVSSKIVGTEDFPALISSYDSLYVYPLFQGEGHVNPIKIEGKEYTLSCSANIKRYNDTYHYNFIYQIERMEEVEKDDTLRKYSIIATDAMRSLRGAYANVFFIGENGGYNNVNELIGQIQDMICYSQSKRFVVVSFHKPNEVIPSISRMAEMEDSLSNAFGPNFLNLRQALLSDGISLTGIKKSVKDEEAMINGEVPPSLLMKDGIHFTGVTKKAVATMVYNKLMELKYIE